MSLSVRWKVEDFVADELGIDLDVSRNLVNLFDEGNEIAFIARYRRHLTGNATPDDLRHALDAYNSAKNVKTRAEKLIKRADNEVEDVRMKENLKAALSTTMVAEELESLFEPFKKTKKGTLALRALELGVDAICARIFNGEFVAFHQFVNPRKEGLETLQKVEKETMNLLSHDLHKLEDTQALILKISESMSYYAMPVMIVSSLSKKAKALKEGDKDFPLLEHFKLYTNFERDARSVLPFQIMALERAESKGIIGWKARADGRIAESHPGRRMAVHPAHRDFLLKAVADSTKRFFFPSIERNVRQRLVKIAERSAIDCFAKNVRELLLTEPLKGTTVVAIDPGYSHGCKCALVSDTGEVLGTTVFYLVKQSQNNWDMDKRAESIFLALVTSVEVSGRLVIAIGNGTASREVQRAISAMIGRNAFAPRDVHYCVISECGASIYSASEIAAEELPNMDVNLRSAVSLARRVINPISEYVKIAPKHLGVGSYQHSVNEKRLDEMLDVVVRECVSLVGVDVNVASLQLLQKVSGLNKKTAANIIKFRQTNGRIFNRESIQEISGIGPKSFEQCAGFLFVYEGDATGGNSSCEPSKKKRKVAPSKTRNPLDCTAVHPESYHLAERLIEQVGGSVEQIGSELLLSKLRNAEDKVKSLEPEVALVWELLTRPLLSSNPPQLLKALREMNSLKIGDVLEGVVMNHAQFGVFIDIGVGRHALAHHSKLPSIVPQVNSRVRVLIEQLELSRGRIGVIIQ